MHKKKAGKLQNGSTFPKQYWLAVNGKPKTLDLSDNDLPVYEKGQFNASELPTSLEMLILTGNPQPDNNETTVTYPCLSVFTNLKSLYIDGKHADFCPEYSKMNIKSLSLATRGMRGNCTLRQLFKTTLATLTSIESLTCLGANWKTFTRTPSRSYLISQGLTYL